MGKGNMKFLIIGLLALVFISGCAQSAPEEASEEASEEVTEALVEEIEIEIGVLADLSGPLTTYGEDIQTTVTIASEDVNAYFENKGMPYRVKLYIEDTKVDPKIALDKVMALHAKGIKLIVGPMGSGEVKNILPYISSNKIVIASPSSTAPPSFLGVTKPDEKKFASRFVAGDAFQTIAIAKLAQDKGVKGVVITHVANAWGAGLEEFGTSEFEKLGIEVKSSVEYPDPAPADFTPYVATLESTVEELLETREHDEVAVVAFSYEEVGTILAQVDDDSVLLTVIWIGCDGTAKSQKVIDDVSDKASLVKLYSTVSETHGGSELDELKVKYAARIGGEPKSYGLNAYDSAFVIAIAAADVFDIYNEFNTDEIAISVPFVAEKYSAGDYGPKPVSGALNFDVWLDRAVTEYIIYSVEDQNWKESGVWEFKTNTINWN